LLPRKSGRRDNATGGSIAQIFAECASDEFVSAGGARSTSCASFRRGQQIPGHPATVVRTDQAKSKQKKPINPAIANPAPATCIRVAKRMAECRFDAWIARSDRRA